MGTAIVIGVGPDQGLGAQLCKRFAAEGLNVLVAGPHQIGARCRRSRHLAAGGRATAVVADATSEADTVALFDRGRRRPRTRDLQRRQQHGGQDHRYGRPIISSKAGASCVSAASCSGARPSAAWCRRGQARCCSPAPALRFGVAPATVPSILRRRACARWRRRWPRNMPADGIHVGHVVVDGAIGGEKIKTRFPGGRQPRGASDQHRGHRRWLRVPAQAAAAGLVVRTRRADLAREVVTGEQRGRLRDASAFRVQPHVDQGIGSALVVDRRASGANKAQPLVKADRLRILLVDIGRDAG